MAKVLTDTGEELNPYRWIILVGLITAAILEVLDSTVVNVALPTIAGNLGATMEEVAWVSTGYILSNVIVLPLTAWLSSRFGRRRYLSFSIILFIVSSFLCGTATSLAQLVGWRILQGAGGAALLSTAQATLREIFPKEQQGTVQSIYVLGVIAAPTIGPALGGYITDNYSWPWIFYINVPIGLFSAAIVLAFLFDATHKMQTVHVDFLGIALLAVGLGSLQYVLEEGNIKEWFDSKLICGLTALSIVCLVSMVTWELWPTNHHPVVNFRVLKNRDLSAALMLFLALGFGLYGGTFLFPLFVQNIVGFTPTATGMALMPGGIATGVSAIMCGQLLNRPKPIISSRMLISIGLVLFMGSMWDLGHMTGQSGEPDTRWALALRGFGLGMLFIPINLTAFNSLKGIEIAQGASLLNLMRQLGGSLGIAVLSTYITRQTAAHTTYLVAHTYVGNPFFDQRMSAMTAALMNGGADAQSAHYGAVGFMNYLVQIQALSLSYNDAFILIGACTALVSPMVFLLGNKKKAGPPVEMH